ncbi:MAG: hypothetical protein ACI89L_000929 [Phycisphaerales bacterium]|jgi:hypothetical protein
MSDQINAEQNPNPSTTPSTEDLGRGLTGLSSAWPLYVGESRTEPETKAPEGPRAAAG